MSSSSLRVEIRGDGFPIVLLHGTPTHPAHLRPLAERLASRWRTLLVHLPGCGESAPLRPYDLDTSHALVEDALMANGVRSACFVGMSGGSYRSVAIAGRARIEARAIAMLGPIVSFDAEKRAGLQSFADTVRSGGASNIDVVGLMLGESSRADPAAVADVNSWMQASAPEDLASELDAWVTQAESLTATLAALNVPVLLRVGDNDLATPPAIARDIAMAVPRSTLEIVAGRGHALLSEDFADTSASIERFFASATDARAS